MNDSKKNRDDQEVYILVQQVHFGSLKTSVPKGTKIVFDRKAGQCEINGVRHENANEMEICIRAGYAIPFVDGETNVDNTVKISPRAQKANRKYEVESSIEDNVIGKIEESCDADKKSEKKDSDGKMPVIHEGSGRTARGISVIPSGSNPSAIDVDAPDQVMRVINGEDQRVVGVIPDKPEKTAKKAPSLSNSLDAGEDCADMINGMSGEVVAVIPDSKGKVETKASSGGKKLVAKHGTKESAAKAKERAAARKKEVEARKNGSV